MAEILEASLTVSGGLLGAPRTKSVVAGVLAAADQAELARLVAALEREGAAAGSARPGSEVKQFEIAVKSGGAAKAFEAREGGESAAFRALRSWLETKGSWATR
ncbi:MAG TPA: protealysin inhibitor emfourin [Candidatus Cybelea sp.]|nr:protealysin inhibitor emfourin [Candidatus Cybelea sp.]